MSEDKKVKLSKEKKEEAIGSASDVLATEEEGAEVSKDLMGLEELPDEIKKKLEKKKAENAGKDKIKRGKFAKKKKKVTIKVPVGKAFVSATYNNTIVTLTDVNGNVLSWASAGVAGFKGAKKSTPYASQIITRIAVGKAREEYSLSEVSVFVRGVGTGREAAVRALNSNGLIITSIKDITPVPHNGCRKRKPRRV